MSLSRSDTGPRGGYCFVKVDSSMRSGRETSVSALKAGGLVAAESFVHRRSYATEFARSRIEVKFPLLRGLGQLA